MATYEKRLGKWRVGIFKKGVRRSASFDTKEEAQRWAASVEFTLKQPTRRTLHDALQRYLETVSIHKKGERWERLRIAAFKRQLPDRLLASFTSDAIAKWRDTRLESVSTGTVRREMNLFGNVIETAVTEWQWLEVNPFRVVKRPPDGKARDRIISITEAGAFVKACRTPLEKRVGKAFVFALETGMRAGEICSVDPKFVHAKLVRLPDTKNGTARDVPLSKKARKLIPADGFGLTSQQLDIHFRNVRDRLGQDYTFHATRHTAATRIGHSGKLSPYELCRMFGWKDLNMAMRYVTSSVASIADRL